MKSPEQWCENEYDRLTIELSNTLRELADVKEDRDRLRMALREIENTPPENLDGLIASSQWWARLVLDIKKQARAALQEDNDE